jgi:DNA invertase Pin-like site-specific DNA recombinase
MSLTNKEMTELKKIVARAKELIVKAQGNEKATAKTFARRTITSARRRTGKELEAFRRMLKAERKAGVPVAQIAKKNGITPAYIYQMG